jgi:hypothetical protein
MKAHDVMQEREVLLLPTNSRRNESEQSMSLLLHEEQGL